MSNQTPTLFFRGEDGTLYRLTRTLAPENQYIEAQIEFHEDTFFAEIICEDTRIYRLGSEVYIDAILQATIKENANYYSVARYCYLDTPFTLKILALDLDSSISLIQPIEREFVDIIKTETFPEEFKLENTTALSYFGVDDEIRLKRDFVKGFGKDFTANTGTEVTKVSGTLNYFGENAFKNSKLELLITDSTEVYVFENSAFENSPVNIEIQSEDLPVVSKIGDRAFKGTQVKDFSLQYKDNIYLGKEAFKDSTIENFYITGNKEKNLPFFSEGFFDGCKNLKTVTGDQGFNFRAIFPKNCFRNCENLEIIHDNKDVVYGKHFSIMELGVVEPGALVNCKSISNNNLFILYRNSTIAKGSLDGADGMMVLFPADEGLSEQQVKEKFYLPKNSSVFLYWKNYFVSNTSYFIYFWHQLTYKHTYHYMLKYISDEETFSFQDQWSFQAPPYQICSYCFTGTPIKDLYIPKGTHKICSKAFFDCEDLELRIGDYEPGKYWEEDWNLKGFDENGNKVFHQIKWNSRS